MQFNEQKNQIMIDSLPDFFKDYIKEVNTYNQLKNNYSQVTNKSGKYHFFEF